jgi:hypothetical protein|nr:MAG TPA: hypothetical protein [Caudoviricetes sp.]
MAVRPIDAVQVLNDINWHHKPTPVSEFESGFNQGLNQAMWIITHAPTLAPPEIVYCQDCVYLEDGCVNWCNKWEHICPDDSEFFCKYGRKKKWRDRLT